MVLIIDAIKARCPKCGHEDFAPQSTTMSGGNALACGECGEQVLFATLMADIRRRSAEEDGT